MRKIIEATNPYLKLNSATRKKINKDLSSDSLGSYHKNIPIQLIQNILADYGILMLQEDGTEFSGFFCGRDGHCYIDIGFEKSLQRGDGYVFYDKIENSVLYLSWYQMSTGRYEIVCYVS